MAGPEAAVPARTSTTPAASPIVSASRTMSSTTSRSSVLRLSMPSQIPTRQAKRRCRAFSATRRSSSQTFSARPAISAPMRWSPVTMSAAAGGPVAPSFTALPTTPGIRATSCSQRHPSSSTISVFPWVNWPRPKPAAPPAASALPSPTSPTARTSVSFPAAAMPASSSPYARTRSSRAISLTSTARCWVVTEALADSPSGSGGASESPRISRSMSLESSPKPAAWSLDRATP